MIGQEISHYEILEKIGRGGMGSVFKAKDLKLDRFVAIKFLNKDLLTDEESRLRFINEAKTVSSIDHPNIAVVHEIDEFEDSIFIAMGFYEGQTLQELIAQSPLPLPEIYSFAIQIARGLAEAHESGVIHRDIKPANIMVTKNGQVKILDFGLSKGINMTELTRQDTVLGTAAYMSPEQIQGKPLDHLTDIFSFGIMLYEMTAGERPFAGEYGAAVSYSIMHEDPPPIRGYRPETPDALETIILKALSKEETERYQSATEIERDFKALQDGDGVKTSLRPKRSLEMPRKRTWILATSLLMLGLLFSLFTVFKSGPATSDKTNSIVVLPFAFEGTEDSWGWLGDAITELINTNLAEYNSLQVSPSRQGAQIMQDLGHESAGRLSKAVLIQVAERAKVKSVVSGTLIKAGNELTVRAAVLKTDEGDFLATIAPFTGEPQKLNELAANISSQLVSLLKIEANAGSAAAEPTQSLDAFRFFLEGRDAAFDRRFPESIDKLQKALAFDSTFASAYRWLAYSFNQTGDITQAKKVLTEGRPYISDLSEEARLEYLCDMAQTEGRWRDYATYLEQLLQIKPLNAGNHGRYGWAQKQKFRRFETGIREMEKALQLDSTLTWLYNDLAFAYLENGEQQKAFESIEKYISANPTDVNPLDSKAQMQLRVGQYQGAILNYERVLSLQPDFLSARPFLAETHMALGQFSRALEILNEHMEITYSSTLKSIGLASKAKVYFLKGEFQEALQLTDQALTFDPSNTVGHWLRANILLQLENEEALQNEIATLESTLRELGGLDGRWFLYHLNGQIALQKGEHSRAIESFRSALDLKPQDRSFYLVALGDAYYLAEKLPSAIQQYEAALAFNPNNAHAALGIAKAYERSALTGKAKNFYKKVAEIWSEADEGIAELELAKQKYRLL